MTSKTRSISLRNLRSDSFKDWLTTCRSSSVQRIFIATSGYEKRGRHWASKVLDVLPGDSSAKWLVIAFTDCETDLSRSANNTFYRDHNIVTSSCYSREKDIFLELVRETVLRNVEAADNNLIEVHVDYSCMPRIWYCNLPKLLEPILRTQDRVFFWYSIGDYSDIAELPTAGIDDFSIFAGKATLGAAFRTHLFGLGFDRIRSQSLLSVLDPQSLVCFYAGPYGGQDYHERIEKIHSELLSQTNYECSLPLDDFHYSFSKLSAIVKEFHNYGDIILVPDGPKPLIFISSLIPLFLEESGILCFHVTRRMDSNLQITDIPPAGPILGFSFTG